MIKDLPEKLKLLRVKYGYSQKQVADKVNISPSIISGYETGERTPSTDAKTGDGSMSLLLTVNLLLSNIYYHLFFCLSRKHYDMKKLKAPSPRELNLFLLFIRRQRTVV